MNYKKTLLVSSAIILSLSLAGCKNDEEKTNNFDQLMKDDESSTNNKNTVNDKKDDTTDSTSQDNTANVTTDNQTEGTLQPFDESHMNNIEEGKQDNYSEEKREELFAQNKEIIEEATIDAKVELLKETKLFKLQDLKWYTPMKEIKTLLSDNKIAIKSTNTVAGADLLKVTTIDYGKNKNEYIPPYLESLLKEVNNLELYLISGTGDYYGIKDKATDDTIAKEYLFKEELLLGYGFVFKTDKSIKSITNELEKTIGSDKRYYFGPDIRQEGFYIDGTMLKIYEDYNNKGELLIRVEFVTTEYLLRETYNITEK